MIFCPELMPIISQIPFRKRAHEQTLGSHWPVTWVTNPTMQFNSLCCGVFSCFNSLWCSFLFQFAVVLSSCFSLLRCFLLFPIPVPAPPPPSLTALQPPSLTPLASYLYICVCIGVRSTTARRTSVALSPLWCFLSCQFAVVHFSCFRAHPETG